MIIMKENKLCNDCKKIKLILEFYKRKDINGYRSSCKECFKKKTIQYQKKSKKIQIYKQKSCLLLQAYGS